MGRTGIFGEKYCDLCGSTDKPDFGVMDDGKWKDCCKNCYKKKQEQFKDTPLGLCPNCKKILLRKDIKRTKLDENRRNVFVCGLCNVILSISEYDSYGGGGMIA